MFQDLTQEKMKNDFLSENRESKLRQSVIVLTRCSNGSRVPK